MEPMIRISPNQGSARRRVSINVGVGGTWSGHLELSIRNKANEVVQLM